MGNDIALSVRGLSKPSRAPDLIIGQLRCTAANISFWDIKRDEDDGDIRWLFSFRRIVHFEFHLCDRLLDASPGPIRWTRTGFLLLPFTRGWDGRLELPGAGVPNSRRALLLRTCRCPSSRPAADAW